MGAQLFKLAQSDSDEEEDAEEDATSIVKEMDIRLNVVIESCQNKPG